METPRTLINLYANREARNAVFGVIAVVSISFLSISSLISPMLTGQSIPLVISVETFIILLQILISISALALILRGQVEVGVWRLCLAFLGANLIRTVLRESIGLPIGVITALVVTAIGYLSLSAPKAGRAAILGYGVGGMIVLFDLLASTLYPRQPTPPDLVVATRNLAIFVFAIQLVVLVTQARALSFSTKISNYFSLFTLVAVIIVGFTTVRVIDMRFAGSGGTTETLTMQLLESVQRATIVTGVIVSFLGVVLGVTLARTLTDPLNRLAKSTAQLAQGDLDARAAISTEDEVGELAEVFNSMADSLKGVIGQLEERVEDRTKYLQRRAVETQVAVEIGRAATSMRDLKSLMDRTVELVTERFGFYHCGIFLVDENKRYAVLQAASSEGGKKMLERNHRLKIGQTGIVGFVTGSGTARIALDVGQDAVFFDNPDLPRTRSEMALPLIAGGQILGALDVQSYEEQAFDDQDIATLQILADQLAIAIENARLFGETQKALEATRVAYGEISREAWAKIIQTQPRISYKAAPPGTVQVNRQAPDDDVTRTIESGDVILSMDGQTIGIPVKIRGQAIGALRLKKQDTSNPWTQEETALAVALSEQLSGALESARLYRESQQRAARESLVADISGRITALPRVDTILRETVQELGQAIGNASVTFQLLETADEQNQIHSAGNGNGKQPGDSSQGVSK